MSTKVVISGSNENKLNHILGSLGFWSAVAPALITSFLHPYFSDCAVAINNGWIHLLLCLAF